MRRPARSLLLIATLGVACFQDVGPLGVSDTVATDGTTSTATATTGGSTGGSTGDAATDATTGSPMGAPCEAYYWSDFSADPGSDWTVFSPTWLWLDSLFRGTVTGQAGAGAQLEAGEWQDFTLHVRLRLGPTSYGGVVLRAADQFLGDFLYIQLDSTDGDLEGFRADSVDANFGFTGLVTANKWQELVVRFEGTNLTISLDGAQLATGLQVQGLAAGGVGVIVLQGTMEVDQIAVCPP